MNEITFLPKNGVKIDVAKLAKRMGKSETRMAKLLIQLQVIIQNRSGR